MPLLSIWATNPETVFQFSIEQVVATAGNGRLLDNSECSLELREYLSQVTSEKLAEYADYCLTHRFEYNGKVLQDVVNELGRRLDYTVTNGRYQGAQGSIGNDGLWESPEGHHLLVEVKTTDAYSISLDTIARYRNSLLEQKQLKPDNSMLLVVGRYDTGQLEAQVRGSRHAWDMRLISVDSLVNLVNLKENTEDENTSTKIRSVLVPMEYTRLDRLIDVMFATAKDVEKVVEIESNATEIESNGSGTENDNGPTQKSSWDFTDTALIERKRTDVLSALGLKHGVKLIKKSRAMYWNSDRSFRVATTISKLYSNASVSYWYAYHPSWQEFLEKGEKGYFVLGCMDLDIAFAIPLEVIESKLSELNTTDKVDSMYWHIHIRKSESGYILLSKSGNHLDLSPYTFSITSNNSTLN